MVGIFVAIFVLVVITLLLLKKGVGKDIPGPTPIPILGNLHQIFQAIKSNPYPFTAFCRKYGDIIKLRMPMREIIIISSHETINEILVKEETLGRDINGILQDRVYSSNIGIIFAHGEIWDKTRKWTVRNLRDYGFGKTAMLQNLVRKELTLLFQQWDEKNGEYFKMNMGGAFMVPGSRTTYHMIAGDDAEVDPEYFVEMNVKTSEMEKATGFTGSAGAFLTWYFPSLRYLFPNWTGRTKHLECTALFAKEARKLIQEAKEKVQREGDSFTPETFTEKFAVQILKGDTPHIFNDLNYEMVFTDMFQGSSVTTSGFLDSLFLYMVLYPEVQGKIREEIDRHVPPGTEVTYEDKPNLIYTQATMLEVHRVTKLIQLLIPRDVMKTFQYRDYVIKKGTLLMADINALYTNPKIFPEPELFKPERFLTRDGELDKDQTKLIMPFGVGPRKCPGDQQADVGGLLYFTNIVRRYELSVVPGEPKPTTDLHIGFSSSPHPYNMMMKRISLH